MCQDDVSTTFMLEIFIRIIVILSFPSKIKLEDYFNTLDSSPFLRNKVLMKSLCAGLVFSSLAIILFLSFPPWWPSQPCFSILSPPEAGWGQPGPLTQQHQ